MVPSLWMSFLCARRLQRRRPRHLTRGVCQGSATGLEVFEPEAQQSTEQQQWQQQEQQRLQLFRRTERRGLAACNRRAALPVFGLALFGSALPCRSAAADEEASLLTSPDSPSTPVPPTSQETEFVTYANQSLRYSLIRPANWEAVSCWCRVMLGVVVCGRQWRTYV